MKKLAKYFTVAATLFVVIAFFTANNATAKVSLDNDINFEAASFDTTKTATATGAKKAEKTEAKSEEGKCGDAKKAATTDTKEAKDAKCGDSKKADTKEAKCVKVNAEMPRKLQKRPMLKLEKPSVVKVRKLQKKKMLKLEKLSVVKVNAAKESAVNISNTILFFKDAGYIFCVFKK